MIFWVHRAIKGQKTVQNDKKFCLSCSMSQEPYIIWLWFLVHICKMMISQAKFLIFQNWFLGFLGGKRAKNNLKSPIWVCFTLYLKNCRLYHQDFDNDIYRCFSLFFFKNAALYILTFCFLLAHFNCFLNNCLFFKFINKCQKEILRGAPPSSHRCDFFDLRNIH